MGNKKPVDFCRFYFIGESYIQSAGKKEARGLLAFYVIRDRYIWRAW